MVTCKGAVAVWEEGLGEVLPGKLAGWFEDGAKPHWFLKKSPSLACVDVYAPLRIFPDECFK